MTARASSELAQETGVAERVRFLGAVDPKHLVEAYRMADLFVMPSTGEGFGIAFLEAMASGTAGARARRRRRVATPWPTAGWAPPFRPRTISRPPSLGSSPCRSPIRTLCPRPCAPASAARYSVRKWAWHSIGSLSLRSS